MSITYVSFVTNKICIENVSEEILSLILGLGGVQDDHESDRYFIPFADKEEKLHVFSILRDSGIAFSAGKEWCPAEQFEEYRDMGLLSGKYKHIGWNGPSDFVISEK